MTAATTTPDDVTIIVNLGEERVLAFAAKAAMMAFNRLEGPIRQALAEAEDIADREAIVLAIVAELSRAFTDAFILRSALLD